MKPKPEATVNICGREFTKSQWRRVTAHIHPEWTDTDFEVAWLEFVLLKTSGAFDAAAR